MGIKITKVKYNGDAFFFESPLLSYGLNIIEGSNGTGKSTFINFIYYALSGKVNEFSVNNRETHFEIINDTNNYVELDLEINQYPYQLRRFINKNDILIIEPDGKITILPIFRNKNEKIIFSDWILEKLEITVVEVFQGISNFKINIKDLFRLIYHNQEPDPKKIYKPADSDNYISDSELVRKIIFELLLGKTYSKYYTTLAKYKEAEKNRYIKKGLLDEYISIFKALNIDSDDLNIKFLGEKKIQKEDQLSKLYAHRDIIKVNKQDNDFVFLQINELKSKIIDNEFLLNEKESIKREVREELSKLNRLKESIILEVTQIQKIVHTHEKLNLFSVDTCPYCLREVDRKKGFCVCGSEIDENQYEKFFYEADEYIDILKSKQKSVETIDNAIEICSNEKFSLESEIDNIKETNILNKNKIRNLLNDLETNASLQELNSIDDRILEVREEINNLNQRIQTENKRDILQRDFNDANTLVETLRGEVKLLEAEASIDIKLKVSDFSKIYNKLMISTLKNCRTAKISNEDYMPIIDDGLYKEASAYVPVRLMYYLSILYLSLNDSNVSFPSFLLIDTPETSGVDTDNLLQCLKQISEITAGQNNFQIILSTGIGKYPLDNKGNVFLTLTEPDGKLLKKKLE